MCKVYLIKVKDLKNSIQGIREIPNLFTDLIQFGSFNINNKRDYILLEIQDVNC
ncbi:hypothetical protein QTG96_07875 [Clostridium perfringens]|nr:hypothetical protein [Clostridium perfringens]